MPVRGTLESSKALQLSGFGIQEGRVLFEDARFKVIQRQKGEKKGGGLVTPMLVLQLDCKKVNENNVAESDAVELTELLVSWGSKEAGENGLHSFALWPGVLKGSAADSAAEIDDLSEGMADEKRAYVRIDVEGDTFVSADGAVPFADSEAMLFMKSLEAHGWKPEINAQCWAGNYKGAVVSVKTVIKEDLCKRLGIKYNKMANEDPTKPPTCWEVVDIHVRPYEAAGKGKGAGASKAAGKSTSSAQKTTTAGATSSGANGQVASGNGGDDFPKASPAFAEFVGGMKAGTSMSHIDFQKKVGPVLMQKAGFKEAQAFVNANVKNIEALGALGLMLGFEVDGDAKTVTFGG